MDSASYIDLNKSEMKVEEVSDDAPPSKKFEEFMEEEEVEEEEPLFDGPVSVPLPSIFTPATHEPPKLPPALVSIISEIAEPIKEAASSGITKTVVYIQSDALSEIKLTIDHYDTAPHSFNIYLSGNEKACALFTKYQNELAENLQRALPSFHCNFFTPSFRRKNALVKTRRLSYGAEKVKKYD